MACFIVPAAEAAVITIAAKIVQKKEKAPKEISISFDGATIESAHKISFSRKLKWLSYLQWGGVILLAFEHLWHGEIVPWFPFLTAAAAPESTAAMLQEMATVGVCMALLTTAVWLCMLGVAALIEHRAVKESAALPATE